MGYSVIRCLSELVCVTLPIHLYALSPVYLSCLPISCVFCPCVIILNCFLLYAYVSPVCDYVFSYTCFILCFILYTLCPVFFCCLLTITSCICVLLYHPECSPENYAKITAIVCNYPCLLS